MTPAPKAGDKSGGAPLAADQQREISGSGNSGRIALGYFPSMRLRYLALLFIISVPTVWLLVMMALATIRRKRKNACGSCGGKKVRLSWPGFMMDHALANFGLVPYKCEGCLRRFYGWRAGRRTQGST